MDLVLNIIKVGFFLNKLTGPFHKVRVIYFNSEIFLNPTNDLWIYLFMLHPYPYKKKLKFYINSL